jgi:hypothetical protein
VPTVYDSGTSMASPAPASSLSVTMFGHAAMENGGWTGVAYFGTDVGNTAAVDHSGGVNFNFSDSISMTADVQHDYQAFVRVDNGDFPPNPGTYGGGFSFFTTTAMLATASAPTSSLITSTGATLACNFFPNTNSSTATCGFQYRVLGTTTWTNAATSNFSGYNQQTLTTAITGLTCGTTYEFRLNMTRTTVNDTTLTSSISSFTTTACLPTIATNNATNVGITVATLNGTVNPNNLSSTYCFVWGTTLGGPYPNRTSDQGPNSGGSNVAYSANITGLSATTTYYYKAVVTYPAGTGVGTDYFGSEVSFSTAASAAQARIMPSIFQYERKKAIAADGASQGAFYFGVEVPSATNSDRFLSAAVPWNAGDVQISKDGGAFANVSALPTRVAGSLYKQTLTAAEMTADDIVVLIQDQDADTEWRDTMLLIQTRLRLGQMDIDTTGIGSNTDALKLTGSGTGFGLNAIGGATASADINGVIAGHIIRKNTATGGGASTITLDAGASATNNFYNGCLVLVLTGVGAAQARVITGYTGSTQVATVNRSWSTNPASGNVFVILPGEDVWNIGLAELTTIPTATDTTGNKAQFVFQRFAFKRTQTVTTQSLFKSDNSTVFTTATVSDDGTTQTSGRLT